MNPALAEIPTQWNDLTENFSALRPIRSATAHQRALLQVRKLIRLKRLTRDQKDYHETLAVLVEKYEMAQYGKPEHDPIGNLRFLMDQHDMNASDLGKLLGNRSMGSLILTGRRGLSKATIEKLCARFNVGPAVFFPEMT